MNAAYGKLLATVAPVFVVIACGFAMRRLGKLRPEADSSLFSVAVNFLYPCLIAHSVLGNAALRDLRNVLLAPLVGALLLLGSLVVAVIAARLLRLNRPQPSSTFAFTAAIPNWGYLPIPLVQGLFPESTTGVLFVHNIGLELMLWSVGVWFLAGEGSWRRAFNIPFFAILAALGLNLLHAGEWLPGFVLDSLRFLGQAALPLSLLLTGVSLADAVGEGGLLRNAGTTLAGCVVKLGVLPPLILLAAKWLPCSVELKQVLVVQAAMPCAMVPVILARYYNADSGTAVRIVLASTILGLLTIPLWLRIGGAIVGV
jgi:malate permease and related proteins